MDTLAIRRKEFCISSRGIEYGIIATIILTFILTSNTFQQTAKANDLIANTSISTPVLTSTGTNISFKMNPIYVNSQFENNTRIKYSGGIITDIDRGIKHIKLQKIINGRKVKLNIIEMNQFLARKYEIKPATASEYTLKHKTTLTTIANRTNSIVAVNGGFFKQESGIPLGTLMINEKLYTGPIYNRVALGIFDNGYDVARIEFRGSINANGQTIKIDSINQPRILSSYVLAYSRDWGSFAPVSPRNGVQLQIVENRIVKVSANPLFIPENGYVIVGPKEKLSKLFGAENVQVNIALTPQWQGVKHIISGGPYLVRNGQVFVDTAEEKLNAISGRNPRTAIGYTPDNTFIIVTVDGREKESIGVTLQELAWIMKSIGCINAINLDGGGSTVMYVNGDIVNKPPQPGGIAISNALLISKKY